MDAAQENAICIKNISKVFVKDKPPALDSISATIPKGEIVGLVGPDGAGKTTLIRMMAALFVPTSGELIVNGYNTVEQAAEISNCIGYMPQKFGLYEDLTVLQNLNLYADLQGVPKKDREETFEKLLAFTTLKPFTGRLAGALSGGMKQKLGLACVLVRKPEILLLDEPSVGVDPISRKELWKMVGALLQEGVSVVWSTSYLDEAERCTTVLLLNEGKLLYHGPSTRLTEKMRGKTFCLTSLTVDRRKLIGKILKQDAVVDATIQGKDIRVVLKEQGISIASPDDSYQVKPAEPRFEDAFISILGGAPKEESLLAKKVPLNLEKEVLVEANVLTKRFGTFTAAHNISFTIESGEIFGLLGPNGAGKSTTFKMLCGLLKPTSGEASIHGFNLLTAGGLARSHIGYMAQKFSLYGTLSVLQNLNFFSGAYNLRNAARRSAVDEMVEIFNLKPFLHDTADALPLGFKQRLALSCSLMHRPRILFLDEPTSGVDPLTRREFWNHINGLVQRGMTVMVTTHFMDEAEYCDRVALIYKGEMIQLETPDKLKEIVKSQENPNPTLEDAFIHLIEQYDKATHNKK